MEDLADVHRFALACSGTEVDGMDLAASPCCAADGPRDAITLSSKGS